MLVTQKWISKNEIKVLAMEIMFFNLGDVKRKRKEKKRKEKKGAIVPSIAEILWRNISNL